MDQTAHSIRNRPLRFSQIQYDIRKSELCAGGIRIKDANNKLNNALLKLLKQGGYQQVQYSIYRKFEDENGVLVPGIMNIYRKLIETHREKMILFKSIELQFEQYIYDVTDVFVQSATTDNLLEAQVRLNEIDTFAFV